MGFKKIIIENYTFKNQIQKIKEEVNELEKAKTFENKKEEALDVIQSTLTLLLNIYKDEEVKKEDIANKFYKDLKKHDKKIDKNYKTDNEIDIDFIFYIRSFKDENS